MSDINALIAEVKENMPEPSPVSFQTSTVENEDDEKNNETSDDKVDTIRHSIFSSDSEPLFDPDVHRVDDAGNPVLNKNGSYAKKRGRKKGDASPLSGTSISSYEAGRAMAETIIGIGVMLGGEDFHPIKTEEYDEPKQLATAWARYFEAKGEVDVPPWLGVTIATGTYFIARTRMEKTQTKLKKLMAWIKVKTNKIDQDELNNVT